MDVPLATLLVRPRRAFEDAEDPLSVAQALVFVVMLSAVNVATLFPLYVGRWERAAAAGATIDIAVGGQRVAVPAAFSTGIVTGLFQSALLWLLAATVLHLLARGAGGTSRFRQFVPYVGWSFAPYLVIYPLVAVVTAIALATMPDATLRGVLYGAGESAGRAPVNWNGAGLMDTRSPLLTVAIIWMGYVWTGALSVAHGLSRRAAVGVAGAVTALLLLAAHAPV